MWVRFGWKSKIMHTPAPWKCIDPALVIVGPSGCQIAATTSRLSSMDVDSDVQQFANAQLIAIAPEMRDLLANLVSAYDARNITAFNQLMSQAREIATNHQPKGADKK